MLWGRQTPWLEAGPGLWEELGGFSEEGGLSLVWGFSDDGGLSLL